MSAGASPDGRRRLAAVTLAVLVLAGGLGAVAGGAVAAGSPTSPDYLVTGVATAQDSPPAICNRDAQDMITSYNDGIAPIPGFLKFPVTDTAVHMAIESPDGGDFTFETDGEGRVQTYSEGEPESPSLRVYMDCATFQTIVDADDDATVGVFWNEFEAGDVTLEGVGLVNWIIVSILNLIVGLGLSLTDLGLSLGIALVVAFVLFAILALIALVVALIAIYLLYKRVSGGDDSTAAAGASGEDGEDPDDAAAPGDESDEDAGVDDAGDGDTDADEPGDADDNGDSEETDADDGSDTEEGSDASETGGAEDGELDDGDDGSDEQS